MENTTEILKWAGGSSLITSILVLIIRKALGKTKEQVEIAFTESKIYRDLIAELKADRDDKSKKLEKKDTFIEELKTEMKELKVKLNQVLDEHKKDRLEWEAKDESNRKNVSMWEERWLKVEGMYKEERNLRLKLQEQLEND